MDAGVTGVDGEEGVVGGHHLSKEKRQADPCLALANYCDAFRPVRSGCDNVHAISRLASTRVRGQLNLAPKFKVGRSTSNVSCSPVR